MDAVERPTGQTAAIRVEPRKQNAFVSKETGAFLFAERREAKC